MTQATPDNIDIAHVLGSLWRNLGRLIVASILAGGLAYGVFSLMAPAYISEAQLAILARPEANPFSEPANATRSDTVSVRMDKEAINTHARALEAPDLAATIAKELKLAERAEFNAALGPISPMDRMLRQVGIGGPKAGTSLEDRVLKAYYDRLKVFVGKDSRSISIRFTSADRDLAARVANLLAETYRGELARRALLENQDVQAALVPKIEEMRRELSAADAEVERFRSEANLFRTGGQNSGINEQQLAELTAAETKSRTELGEAEARARSAREFLAGGNGEILPDVQRSPNIQRLVQDRARIEGDLARASATMKSGHPVVKQLRGQLSGVQSQLRREVGRVVASLEKEVDVAALRLASVQQRMADAKARIAAASKDMARLSQLEATARAKKGELDRLQAQFEANRARADSRVVPVAAQLIATARPASEPAFPRKGPFTILAALAALMLGAAVAIVRSLFAGARQVQVDLVEETGAARALSKVSADMRGPATAQAPATGPVPEASVADAFVSEFGSRVDTLPAIAKVLKRMRTSDRAVRTLIVGASGGVDPSMEALDVAQQLAKSGETTLVVDWNGEGQGIASLVGIEPSPGMADLLDQKAGFGAVIRRLPASTTHFIPPGEGLASALVRCDADRINLVLDALDEAYQHLIVVGRYRPARDLFETIEGRFDCAVLVEDARRRQSSVNDAAGSFLGFEVADIEVLRFVRKGALSGRGPSAQIVAA